MVGRVPQTPAQRTAAERNLRKGNPKAFSGSQGASQGEPPAEPPADPGSSQGKQTFRAKADAPKARKPRARKVPPRAPAEPPEHPAKGGGLLSGFFDALRG